MRWACCSCANRRSRSSFTLRTKPELRSRGLIAFSRDSAESNGGRWIRNFNLWTPASLFERSNCPTASHFNFATTRRAELRYSLRGSAVSLEQLRDAVHESDVVIFDGTFWSDDELGRVRPGARSARQMNHLPISDGSFDFLRQSQARRKIYTHINNTNPILMPGSPGTRQVEQAGIEIARDGLEIVL